MFFCHSGAFRFLMVEIYHTIAKKHIKHPIFLHISGIILKKSRIRRFHPPKETAGYGNFCSFNSETL